MYQILDGACPFDEQIFLPSRMLYRKAEGKPRRIDADRNRNDGITCTELVVELFSNIDLLPACAAIY